MTMGAIIFAFIGLLYMSSADIDDSSAADASFDKILHGRQQSQLLRRLQQQYLGDIKIFTHSTAKGVDVSGEACVDNSYKLVGGGAFTDWQSETGMGSLLYSSHPKITNNGEINPRCWFGAATGHSTGESAVLTIYAVGFKDKHDEYQVSGWFDKSDPERKPFAIASVGEGYLLIGGGAHTSDPNGTCTDGPLLYGSYPSGTTRWIARSRDRGSDVCYHSVTSYVLGIKHSHYGPPEDYLAVVIKTSKSDASLLPSASVTVDPDDSSFPDWQIMGGGAYDEHNCGGNFLYGMIPVNNKKWECKGKAHWQEDFGVITCYMIEFHMIPM